MSFDKVPNVNVRGTFAMLLNELNFSSNQVLLILENKFWVGINQFNDITCFDLEISPQIIEQTHKVALLTG